MRHEDRAGAAALQVDDLAGCLRGLQQAGNVGAVAGNHVGPQADRGLRHHGIDDVARARMPKQLAGSVSSAFGQVHHVTAAQQSPELYLRW